MKKSAISPPMLSMVDEEPTTKDIEMKSVESRHPNQELRYHTPRRIREMNGQTQKVDSYDYLTRGPSPGA